MRCTCTNEGSGQDRMEIINALIYKKKQKTGVVKFAAEDSSFPKELV